MFTLLPRLRPSGLVLLLFVLQTGAVVANDAPRPDYRQLIQLAEYIGVDYPEAVANGTVINEGEYREMLEFSQLLLAQMDHSQADKPTQLARNLALAIQNKKGAGTVKDISNHLRSELLSLMPSKPLPRHLLSRQESQSLFQSRCATCHGMLGLGDGPASVGMAPSPTNFTDQERALNRSVLGLYDAISQGIEETAMMAFTQLSEKQRWSLAFYVGSLAFTDEPASPNQPGSFAIADLVNYSPAALAGGNKQTLQALTWLRGNPDTLFTSSIEQPLDLARKQLLAAMDAFEKGQYAEANRLAVSAYLDGFELAENSLATSHPALKDQIEANMMTLRQLFREGVDADQLHTLLATTLAQLNSADEQLSEAGLSNPTLFSASLVILLREGLEALLVTLALAMVLIRSGRRDALTYLHIGWIAALVCGGLSWWAARSLINISGASREVMEGGAAIIAALVLLYVGVWMHNKTRASNWQAYIKNTITDRLQRGAIWGIAGLAFVAVYREVFETVLFYEALLTQSLPAQASVVAGGFIAGVLCLCAITWLIIRYSIRLPIGRFFAITTYLLVALSFILIGKGIIALQEAAMVDISPLPVTFDIDWLGIKSTWQSLLAQAMVCVLFFIFYVKNRERQQQANNG